jgi:hypothetical protein
VDRLSVDYEALVRDLARPLTVTTVGPLLLAAFAERYEQEYEDCSLVQFEQSGATYLFDFCQRRGRGAGGPHRCGLDGHTGHRREARRRLPAQLRAAAGSRRHRDRPGTSDPASVGRRVRSEHIPAASGAQPGLVRAGQTVSGFGAGSGRCGRHVLLRPSPPRGRQRISHDDRDWAPQRRSVHVERFRSIPAPLTG